MGRFPSRCLDHLPANTGRVFMMREFLGFESDEICASRQMKALRQVMQAYAEGRAPSVEPERGVPD